MGNKIMKRFSEIRLVLFVVIIMVLIGVAANVAETPLSEAGNQPTVQRYHIDDAGRIIDSDGRVRGWMKGNEIYGSDLQLKYRFAGRRLESVP